MNVFKFDYELKTLIHDYSYVIFQIIFYYCCFAKWTLVTKIVLGVLNLLNIPSLIALPFMFSFYLDTKRTTNQLEHDTNLIKIHSCIFGSICALCYIWFCFLEKPLPHILKNPFVVCFIIYELYMIKSYLVEYRNSKLKITTNEKGIPEIIYCGEVNNTPETQ